MQKHSPALVGALLMLLSGILLPGPAEGAKKKKATQTFGVIAGSVFQESGRSLRGAGVAVTPKPEAGTPPKKSKAFKAVTDSRGEFAVRVPSGTMRYTVRVEAKGFQSQEKMVTVEWNQRVDVFFRLKAVREQRGASK